MYGVEIHSFYLLTSKEQILVPACSLFDLHSNDINNFNRVFLKGKRVIAMNIIIKTHT